MSDVNPNEAVAEETTIDNGFGEDGPSSFDEMEALTDAPAENTEEVAAKADTAEVSEEQAEIKQEIEEELKMIKALRGDSEHEIPEDAIFKQKVNGVEEEIALRDLLNDYSGKTDWNKKYSELGQKSQDFKKSEFEFNNRVNTFVQKAAESKVDALAYLAETAGADPVEFIREFKQGLIPELEQYMGMSQSEKEAYDYKQELDILRKSQETRDQNVQRTQEFEEMEAQTLKQIEDLGIENHEFAAAYNRLVESGSVDASSIGPNEVAQWIGLENRVSTVDDALSAIDSSLAEDVALIEDLVKTSLEGGLDEQATLEVINELYGQPSEEAKSASAKVRQSGKSLKSVTQDLIKEDKSRGSESGPLSFDDV